jgi:hypothetical protein
LARKFLRGKIGLISLSRILCSTWEWEARRNSELGKILEIFAEIDQKSAGFPVGKVRLLWNREALAKVDQDIAEIEAVYREQAVSACKQIVRLLGWRRLFTSRTQNKA